MLMIAVALVMIMAVLVSALHHYEVVTRRALSGDEADIQLVMVRKWEMAKALDKIPPYLNMPSDIVVTTKPQAVKNDLYVGDNMGRDLFSRNPEGAWNGFPNLVVKRIYKMDPAAAPLPAPPNFKEYRGTPTSANPSYAVYNGRTYRTMTGDFLPVAALAPSGSIHLAGCSGWPNPDLDDVEISAELRYSGLPANVAAGTLASVGNMTYGTVYAGKSIEATNCTLLTPIVGPLPYSPLIGSGLLSQIDSARSQLTDAAASLDNKTQQISGEPPTIGNIIELIFTDALGGDGKAITKKLLGWMSLRTAVEFPFISLPGFSSVAIPGTYYSAQVWFHAPFPPDTEGKMANGAQTPSQLANDLARRLAKLQTARATVNYMLAQIQGGNSLAQLDLGGPMGRKGDKIYEPEGGYDAEGNPIGKFKEVGTITGNEKLLTPQVNPGLKARGEKLQEAMLQDLKTLKESKAAGALTAVSSGLKVNQSLLIWMGDYQGYLLDDAGNVPPTGVDSNLGLGVNPITYSLKATGPSSESTEIYRNDVGYPMLNQGVLLNSKAVFSPLKDYWGKTVSAGGALVRDPSKAPTHQFASMPLEGEKPISESQWRTILDSPDKNRATRLPVNDLDRQIEFYRLLTSPSDANNPFKKVSDLESQFLAQLALIDKKKSEISIAIAVEQEARLFANNGVKIGSKEISGLSNLPKTRHEEDTLKKYKTGAYSQFQNNKGIEGRAYWRYGYSFDMLWNAIAYLADQGNGDANNLWNTYVPLVWWGTKENVYPIQTSGAMDITATFTVPQGRTFYYEHPMTVRGDLWLQRGSTLVVAQGDLEVNYPSTPISIGSTYIQAFDFLPGAKIFMEEGSNIIVSNGNLYCHGPVLPTGQPRAVRPISASIFVPNGDVVLRHGIIPGIGLTDILQSPDLQPSGNAINKNFLYPLMATVLPNLGKAPYTGPFHTRKSYFAKDCTQYICSIVIGPFGIPIPLIMPWPMPRANKNVDVYTLFSFLYTGMANLSLGENLYPASDYWPFQHKENNGVVPILPKINLKSFNLDIGLTGFFNAVGSIPDLPAGDIFVGILKQMNPFASDSFFNTITTNLFSQLIQSVLTSMLPSPLDAVVGTTITGNLSLDNVNSAEAQSSSKIYNNLSAPWDAIQARLGNIGKSTPGSAFKNSLMHEVTGVLVSSRRIFVGYAPPNALRAGVLTPLVPAQRPFLASGLFVASGDININADHTIGAIISTGGNINADKNCFTDLLYYPTFTRASLFMPGMTPVTSGTMDDAMPHFLARALDVTYGVFQVDGSGQKGLDIHIPYRHITAQGWQQQ